MSTTYVVRIDLQTKGDLAQVMHGVAAAARSAQQDIDRMRGSLAASAQGAGKLAGSLGGVAAQARAAHRGLSAVGKAKAPSHEWVGHIQQSVSAAMSGAMQIAGAYTGAVERVAGVGAGVAAVGAFAVGHQIYDGVANLNAELDNTRVSMAAIFNAQGYSTGMDQALSLAGDQLTKMRVDARELPGEFKDLANIMTSIAIPAAHAGLSLDKMRGISSLLMAGGVTAGIAPDQIAREAAQLLEGRAGAHNVLGSRLAGLSGDSAEKFNKMSGAGRVEFLTKELNKYAPALDKFGEAWGGASSTFADNLSNFKRVATEPLYHRVLDGLTAANRWFDKNDDKVMAWANRIGDYLAGGFDVGVEKIKEWGPHVLTFAQNAGDRIINIWRRAEPYAARFADTVQRVMDDPRTFDTIEKLIKLYGAAKVAQIAAPVVGGIGQIASPLLSAGGSALSSAMAGGGGVAAAAGAASGGAVVGVAAAQTAIAAGIVAASVASLEGDAELSRMSHERWAQTSEMASGAWDNFTSDMAATGRLLYRGFEVPLQAVGIVVTEATHAFTWLASCVGDVVGSLGLLEKWLEARHGVNVDPPEPPPDRAPVDVSGSFYSLRAADTTAAVVTAAQLAAKNTKGKRSGTTVQKVEIVVSGNQDPTRLARMVTAEIQNIARHPKVSRDVRDWSKP